MTTTSACTFLMPKAAKTKYLNYQTKTKLRLPFEGAWYVYWGGVNIEDNYHAASSAQRFAIDFVKIEQGIVPEADVIRARQTHFGDGTLNRQYYAFNESILAPGDGKIIAVVNNRIDQHPGKRRSDDHFGNHVIIDHLNGEYSILAHLKQNSIIVRLSDSVKAGDMLGKCGNSGMTTEPHLHYHLQNSPIPNKKGSGLPIYFSKYYSSVNDGGYVTNKMPLRGEIVRHDHE